MEPNERQLAKWSLLFLRLVVGLGFVAHGAAKLSRGPEVFAEVLTALHVPAPLATAWLVVGVELVAGAALAAGTWVRAAALPLAIVLVVAALEVHIPFGFNSVKLLSIGGAGPVFGPPGVEMDLLYLAALAVVVFDTHRRVSATSSVAPHVFDAAAAPTIPAIVSEEEA